MAGIKVDNTWEVTETKEVVRKYTLEEVDNATADAVIAVITEDYGSVTLMSDGTNINIV